MDTHPISVMQLEKSGGRQWVSSVSLQYAVQIFGNALSILAAIHIWHAHLILRRLKGAMQTVRFGRLGGRHCRP